MQGGRAVNQQPVDLQSEAYQAPNTKLMPLLEQSLLAHVPFNKHSFTNFEVKPVDPADFDLFSGLRVA